MLLPCLLISVAGAAVAASSIDSIPLTVIGGDDTSKVMDNRGVITRSNDNRPDGVWFTIVTSDVRSRSAAVWSKLRKIESMLSIGLHGLGTVEESMNETSFRMETASGESVIFTTVDRNDDDLYLIIKFSDISRAVYPEFDFSGSRFYVQILPKGFFAKSSGIELGWEPPLDRDIGGDLAKGARLIESLLFEMVANIEREFGRLCILGRNVRTVEGYCNNLDDPKRGAANQPLRRHDRSYLSFFKSNRSKPGGPTHINVRNISNALFSASKIRSKRYCVWNTSCDRSWCFYSRRESEGT